MMAEERSSSYICAEDISVGYHNLEPLWGP